MENNNSEFLASYKSFSITFGINNRFKFKLNKTPNLDLIVNPKYDIRNNCQYFSDSKNMLLSSTLIDGLYYITYFDFENDEISWTILNIKEFEAYVIIDYTTKNLDLI